MKPENSAITEEKLMNAAGGSQAADMMYEYALEYIDGGNADSAQQIYRCFESEFSTAQKQDLQIKFFLKFGYTIV